MPEGQLASCGSSEIEYLANCATAQTLIPQSVLEGAVYLEGDDYLHCDATRCGEEIYEIQSSDFTRNEINFNYQPSDASDSTMNRHADKQASALFIKDVREAWVV